MTRKLSLSGLAVLLIALPTLLAAGDKAKDAELAPGQARVELAVSGMTCGNCCVAVETAVKKLDGVVAAKADYEQGLATITYEPEKVDVATIVQTINDKTSFKAKTKDKA